MAVSAEPGSAKALRTAGLVAHDRLKPDMVEWARSWSAQLARLTLYATGTTGGQVAEALPELTIHRLKSGPLGGDQQLGALIAEGRIDALIFFVDALAPHPHDVDVKALIRMATPPASPSPATAQRPTRSCAPARLRLIRRRRG